MPSRVLSRILNFPLSAKREKPLKSRNFPKAQEAPERLRNNHVKNRAVKVSKGAVSAHRLFKYPLPVKKLISRAERAWHNTESVKKSIFAWSFAKRSKPGKNHGSERANEPPDTSHRQLANHTKPQSGEFCVFSSAKKQFIMTKKDEVIHSGHFMIANVHDGPDASAVSRAFSYFLILM